MDLPEKSPQHKKMEELLTAIREDPKYTWLMEELWRPGSPVAELLMLPRDRVLPSVSRLLDTKIPPLFDMRLPYFPYADPIAEPLNISTAMAAVPPADEAAEQEEEPEEGPLEAFEDKEIMRLIAHGVVLAIRKNPSLLRCVTADDYDLTMLLRETKDLAEIKLDFLKESEFVERIQEATSLRIGPNDNEADIIVKRAMRTFLGPFSRDPLFLLRLFGEKLESLGGIQAFLRDKLGAYLRYLGLSYESYHGALRFLGEHQLLASYGAIFACPACASHGQPAVQFSFSQYAVTHLNQACSRCGGAMESALIYGVDDLLYDIIESHDGVLAVALAWLLEKSRVDWRYSVSVPGSECDFLVANRDRKTAIEVKMLDSQGSSVEGKLAEAAGQVAASAQALSAEEAWVVYNSTDEETARNVAKVLDADAAWVLLIPFITFRQRVSSVIPAGEVRQHG